MRNIRSLVLAVAAATLPFVAQAAETVFKFTGRVSDSVFADVAVGDLVTGQFKYDPSASSSYEIAGYTASYGFNDPTWGVFEAQVGNHHISASYLNVTVFDNMGGNTEDMMWIHGGYQLKLDDIIYQNGSMGLTLASAPGHTGVINGLGLPTSYDVTSFDAGATLTYGYAQIGGGPGQQLFNFTPLSITAVPEPGSVEMAVMGLLSVGAFLRTRQRRG